MTDEKLRKGIEEMLADMDRISLDVIVGKRIDLFEKLLYHWQTKLKEWEEK